MKRGLTWTFGIVVGLAIIGALLPEGTDSGGGDGGVDDGGSDDGAEVVSDAGDKYAAKAMCEQFVEDRLKAPSTANFSGWGDTEVGQTGEGRWEVAGWVDAENGFGAQIRSVYYCLLEYKGDQRWTAVEVVVE